MTSTAELRRLGTGLLSDELAVLPVRHHSPGCALQLLRAFDELQPSAVLVEGPRSFTDLVDLLADPQTVPPVAVYSYAVRRGAPGGPGGPDGERRRAAYYPFCAHSPELVAVREGVARGLDVRFVDLEHLEQWLVEEGESPEDDPSAPDDPDDPDRGEPRTMLDERRYRASASLRLLAARLGCRDTEELWEHLFEVDAPDLPLTEHVAQVAAYCALARHDATEDDLRRDGTTAREAEMVHHVQQALQRRRDRADAGPVLVVLGGFHAVALPDLLRSPPPRPDLSCSDLVSGGTALIRYSFDRLDRLNGYGAGMTSPAWHQRVFDAEQPHASRAPTAATTPTSGTTTTTPRQDVALDVLQEVAALLARRHDRRLPVPAVRAAFEQVLRLASLRGRRSPVREDVLDAVRSCYVSGDLATDGAVVMQVADEVLGGRALGEVPRRAGTPPLVADARDRAVRQRLDVSDVQRRPLDLDVYRRPEHRLTSRLLHGLSFLGVPFAVRLAGPDFVRGVGLERLRERWEYGWSAATEAQLVEGSVYGPTVVQAVRARYAEHVHDVLDRTGSGDAPAAARLLVQACVLGAHDDVAGVLDAVRTAVGHDPRFAALARATASLGVLLQAREPLEAGRVPELPALLRTAAGRALYLLDELADVDLGDGTAEAVDGLVSLQELVIRTGSDVLDPDLLHTAVARVARAAGRPLLSGAAAGLLFSAGRLDEDEVATMLRGRLRGTTDPDAATAFLSGLLRTAREVAWQQPVVLAELDALLREWSGADFVRSLPDLRLAFSVLTPRETDDVAAAVAGLHGAAGLGLRAVHGVSAAQVDANLALSETVRELLRGDGLAAWVPR